MEDTEGQAKSETSSEEEADAGLDSDVEVIRLNRHLFGSEDLEGLLQAIYATKEIPEPAKESSAQDKMRVSGKEFKTKTWKRFSLKEEEVEKCLKVPKFDAALS